MVVVAQLVRASVCGSEGRGFETHHPPKVLKRRVYIIDSSFFCYISQVYIGYPHNLCLFWINQNFLLVCISELLWISDKCIGRKF